MITTSAPGNGVGWHMHDRTRSTDIFMAFGRMFLFYFMGCKCLSFAKWFRANLANNCTIVMNPKKYADSNHIQKQSIYHIHTNDGVIGELQTFVSKDLQMMWCNHTRHTINFWVDVFLVGCGGEAGWNTDLMAQLRCRWLTAETRRHC